MEKSNGITAEEYLEMRQSVGWRLFPLEQAAEGLKNSAYICCIRNDNTPIAMGRVIWDRGYVVYIADVIVVPEYQGQGLGRVVMEMLMTMIKADLKPEDVWYVGDSWVCVHLIDTGAGLLLIGRVALVQKLFALFSPPHRKIRKAVSGI